MKKILISIILFFSLSVYCQNIKFTRQDTLRGSITAERVWWDLKYYHLDVKVNPADSSLKGQNTILYKVLKPYQKMQIDLQFPMQIKKITQDGKDLKFTREGNAFFVLLEKKQKKGDINKVIVDYEGKPKVGRNPPWDGGLSWKKDSNNNPYITTTCQGDGASLWWPCKDHQYDEPDSMLISVTVPSNLTDVSNGRLRSVKDNPDNTKTFNWFVSNPINNYCVNLNIGNYVHFSEKYKGEKGILDCDYYVLPENLEKAKIQFQDVKRMLAAFEHWFGPYPFYEDSYKLVDVSYTGMEHQSSVTYGNGYKNGYRGRDNSGTGWGMKFDFIIIHESAHEWFGNSITSKDIADMWIHESFGNYSETLFTDYHFGKKAGNEYSIGTRKNIKNDRPVISAYNVNNEPPGDQYAKGANMLHTLRQIVNDDNKFRNLIRGISKTFYHQTVTTEQIEKYISKNTGMNLKPFFNQYLRTIKIPVFEYTIEGKTMKYRWNNCVEGFSIPLRIYLNGSDKLIHPSADWKQMEVPAGTVITTDPNFYVFSKNLNEKK
jgi:aminopeptidase N